jgi:hypothetical protein
MSTPNWPPPEPSSRRRLWSGPWRAQQPPPPPPAGPPPPRPPRRPDRFPLVAAALVLIALGAIAGAIASSGGEPDRTVATDTVTPSTTPTTPPPTGTVPSAPLNPRHIVQRTTVGGVAVDDGVRFRVVRLRAVRSIPHDRFSGPIVASRSRDLIRADITYVNGTHEALDVFCGGYGAAVVDSNRRAHKPLHNYLDIRGNQVCSSEVEPGGKARVILAFGVPRGRRVRGIEVYNAKAADFDGEDSKIFFALP